MNKTFFIADGVDKRVVAALQPFAAGADLAGLLLAPPPRAIVAA